MKKKLTACITSLIVGCSSEATVEEEVESNPLVELCEEIAEACHPVDAGQHPFVSECHTRAHGLDLAFCGEMYDACTDRCAYEAPPEAASHH